ncbi:hypothetical protein [Vreelandella nanhaiensis]|uniref:CopG family transcriptional regulator n=1 Tax=Vreelandella nanhaiensis TaxID=1258546 RepID=A0A433KG04_9GAMM|nr:hypothetical protein [Halomonas nanhaiensis]RUR27719.1 hypothetical protein ELY38_18820 [Halomonas nanhaiensis]
MAEKNRLPLDEELEKQLEAVRQQEGLETIDQAAEWLLRRRLRKGVGSLTGRGRALYEIRGAR